MNDSNFTINEHENKRKSSLISINSTVSNSSLNSTTSISTISNKVMNPSKRPKKVQFHSVVEVQSYKGNMNIPLQKEKRTKLTLGIDVRINASNLPSLSKSTSKGGIKRNLRCVLGFLFRKNSVDGSLRSSKSEILVL